MKLLFGRRAGTREEMKPPLLSALETAILGRSCVAERRENDWTFTSGRPDSDGCLLVTSCLWRIVSGGHVVHAVDDDGQRFGLPAPVDGEHRARTLLNSERTTLVTVDEGTSDLAIQFGRQLRLDVLTISCGYESWNVHFRHMGDEITLVGTGSGLSFASRPVGSDNQVLVGRPLAPA